MKRFFVVFIALLGITVSGNAQQHLWEEGPLTWNHFGGSDTIGDTLGGSWMECIFMLTTADDTNGNNTNCRTRMVCYVDTILSQANARYRTPIELMYNQVLFNLAELECRCFQTILDETYRNYDDDELLMMTFEQYKADETAFNIASNDGHDSTAVTHWLDSTYNLLSLLPRTDEYHLVPVRRHWGMAADFSLGFNSLGKNLTETFSSSFTLGMGVELIHGHSALLFEMDAGLGHLAKTFEPDGLHFIMGDDYTLLQLRLGYGYYVIQKDHFGLMPFLSYGFNSITMSYPYDEDTQYSDLCGSWFAGLMIDFSTTGTTLCPDDEGVRPHESFGLRTKLYVSQANLANYSGIAINAALSIRFSNRPVKIKGGRH